MFCIKFLQSSRCRQAATTRIFKFFQTTKHQIPCVEMAGTCSLRSSNLEPLAAPSPTAPLAARSPTAPQRAARPTLPRRGQCGRLDRQLAQTHPASPPPLARAPCPGRRREKRGRERGGAKLSFTTTLNSTWMETWMEWH